MIRARTAYKMSGFSLSAVLTATIGMGLPLQVNAYQPDGPQAAYAEKNAAKWAQ